MATLSIRHAQQLGAALAPLYAAPDPATLGTRFAAALRPLFGAAAVGVECGDAQGRGQLLGAWPPARQAQGGQPAAQLRPPHPLYEELFVRGNPRPLRLTDFAGAPGSGKVGYHPGQPRAASLPYQLAMGTALPGGGLIACLIGRASADFTPLEQTLLAFVQPHVAGLLAHLPGALGPVPEGGGIPPALGLTRREADILFHLTRGRADKEIGQLCAISARTVQNHLHNIYHKLGVANRTAASLRAVSWL
ncbi:helix-turn-helix transcriptional regulator [Hymenobacter cheonanensis]|uniref:helix-turn-helix transcriptional regulator n=1 Tax=Hymenobacter sp. CA2-7 TaxID=3063993 RepID=UPI00272C5187|nr:helix-turn-helix transcriptional regulator [Hymenobacter sp. CA2-7]